MLLLQILPPLDYENYEWGSAIRANMVVERKYIKKFLFI